MTHEEAQAREMAEAYVNGRLAAAESDAFEEHFFGCAECWNDVETQRKLRAGVREWTPAVARSGTRWQWAFAAAACALIGFVSWAMLFEIPRLKLEVERALHVVPPPAEKVEVPVVMAQANLPVLMLEASRADTATAFALPAGVAQFALWLDAPVGGGGPFRLEITGAGGAAVATLGGLTANAQGALTGSLPATQVPPGQYTARLFGANGGLAGEFKFAVKR